MKKLLLSTVLLLALSISFTSCRDEASEAKAAIEKLNTIVPKIGELFTTKTIKTEKWWKGV